MAKWDPLGGAFRRHGTGDDGGVEDGTFFGLDITILEQSHDRGAGEDDAFSDRFPSGWNFFRDINHRGLVVVVDMSEL